MNEETLKMVREAWRNALDNGCRTFLAESTDEELALDMSDCDADLAAIPGPELMQAIAIMRAENA